MPVTLNKQWKFPRMKYAWVTEYVDKGNGFTLRPGQHMAMLNRHAGRTAAQHRAKGITLHYVNGGTPDPDIPPSQRATIINGENIFNKASELSGTRIPISLVPSQSGWGIPQTTQAVTETNQMNQFYMVVSEISEKFEHITRDEPAPPGVWGSEGVDGNGNPVLRKSMNPPDWNNSPQSDAVQNRLSQLADAAGHRYYGDYAGHSNIGKLFYTGEFGDLRNALASPAAAYNLFRTHPMLNDGFYTKNQASIRHGTIKIYDNGDTNKNRSVASRLAAMDADRLAKQYLGSTRRTVAYGFPGYSETFNRNTYSIRYRRRVPATGGEASRFTFPLWSAGLQVFMVFYALMRGLDYKGWESAEYFGDDPNKVMAGEGYGYQYVGPPIQRYQSALQYNPNAAYPPNPQGFYDLPLVSGDMLEFCRTWTGFDLDWYPHRTDDRPQTVVLASYIVDRYQDKMGYCLAKKDGTKWTVVYQSQLRTGQHEWVTVMLDGQPFRFRASGKKPLAFNLTVTP